MEKKEPTEKVDVHWDQVMITLGWTILVSVDISINY